jgi:hypothetical protein
MKFWSTTLAALFALALMTGCGPKEEAAPTEEAAPMEETAPAETPAEAPASEPGGYVPAPDEVVPPAESGS